eukprot:TRINITY_DN2132_c0_g1_i1.p1 TRINITY_DN2132_c0_g1~~TRINITY_DN2132_c0_g1_i1.p1  ORF type:complete len:714 (-),score=107.20 TRINITY_DN2132_c0_g1_i1:953-3094(-)
METVDEKTVFMGVTPQSSDVSFSDIPSSSAPSSTAAKPERRRSSILSKWATICRFTSQYQSIQEVQRVQEQEKQVEHDLTQMHYFLQGMVVEQDLFLDTKRSVDSQIQKCLLYLMEDSDTSLPVLRARLEPELHKLSDMLHAEIKYYTMIKQHHNVTLSKLSSAISLIQSEGAIRKKLVTKKDKMSQDSVQTRLSTSQDAASLKVTNEKVRKLEMHLEILTDLRNQDVKEKTKLFNAQQTIISENDKLKRLLEEERANTLRLEAIITNSKLDRPAIMKQASKSSLGVSKTKSEQSLSRVGHSEASVKDAAGIEYSSSTTDLSVTDISSRPTSRVSSASHAAMKTDGSHKRTATEFPGVGRSPSAPKKGSKTGESVRQAQVRSSLKSAEKMSKKYANPDGAFFSTKRFGHTTSDAGPSRHETARLVPIWLPGVLHGEPPKSYPIIHAPQKWIPQLTSFRPDVMDVVEELCSKLKDAASHFLEKKYMGWVHVADTSVHNLLKVWQPRPRENFELLHQVGWIFLDIANHYLRMGTHDTAEIVLKKLETILLHSDGEEHKDLKYLIANTHATICFLREKYQNSLHYLQKALKLVQSGDVVKALETQSRIATVLSHMKNYGDALRHLKEARESSSLLYRDSSRVSSNRTFMLSGIHGVAVSSLSSQFPTVVSAWHICYILGQQTEHDITCTRHIIYHHVIFVISSLSLFSHTSFTNNF